MKHAPRSFSEIINLKSNFLGPKPCSLQYRLSPFHSWIRFFDIEGKVSSEAIIFQDNSGDEDHEEDLEHIINATYIRYYS